MTLVSQEAIYGAEQLDMEIRRAQRSYESSDRANERALFRMCTAAYSLADLCEKNPGLAWQFRQTNFHTVMSMLVYLQDTTQPEFIGAGLKLATAIRAETEDGGFSAIILDERIEYYEEAKALHEAVKELGLEPTDEPKRNPPKPSPDELANG